MSERGITGGVGASQVHDSAHLHVTGEATYIDDIAEPRGTLHAAVGMSQRAHARIDSLDLSRLLIPRKKARPTLRADRA